MCGIAGIISKDKNEITVGRLKKMTDSIFHRGPDGEGHWINEDNKVGFGHRRLSIIDLSEEANQPMHFMDRYTIVFNGEIYNYIEIKEQLVKLGYHFHTSSDTEVLMALYDREKENCLQQLDGMFAFAIYDKIEKTVFCARDRFGEKPFHYYFEEGKIFMFGSEMKQLWAAGIERKIDNRMLYNYLQFGFLQNPADQTKTFFENIKRLEQSHYLLLDTETLKIKIKRYWNIDLSVKNDLPLNKASEKFRELFFTSVNRRLRSDVPVGSSLSGGLDSSLVVCVINELNKNKTIRQKTFSAQFPGFIKDESRYQKTVIDKANAEAFFTSPDENVMMNELDKVFFHQEEPFSSSSILVQYEVFKLAKQNGVTVLLDGQGADEYLAGYHPYFKYFFLEMEKNKTEFLHQWKCYNEMHQENKINALYKKDYKYFLRKTFPFAFDQMKKMQLMLETKRGNFSKDFYAQNHRSDYRYLSNFTTLNGILKQSTMGGGLQELLRYADRNSMAYSREVRLPFLNHELVEFVFSLPSTFKINEGWTKYIMRKSFEDILPTEICWRKDKIGYEPPQKKWMESNQMKEMIVEKKKKLVSCGILDKAVLTQPIQPGTDLDKGDNSWAMCMAGKLISEQKENSLF